MMIKTCLAIVAALGLMTSNALAEPVQLSDNVMDRVTAGNSDNDSFVLLKDLIADLDSLLKLASALEKGDIPDGKLIDLNGKMVLLCTTSASACAAAAGKNTVVIVGPGKAVALASTTQKK